ncbi:LOW QUALITY PROTEIN: hypothetical protein CFOL_v3_28430, partial [Cephalotus follicularis]
KIIEQNNYTNKYLQTLASQFSRIENTIQKVKQNYSKNETKTQKIKPLFTPYKIHSSQTKQLTLNEINKKLRKLIVPDTPDTPTTIVPTTSTLRTPPKDKNKIINVIEIATSSNDYVQEINNKLSATKIDPLKIESLISYCYRTTYLDLQIEERGKFTQTSYESGTIYEWNIDGMNEYHIVNKLQERTMVCNAHKIKNNSDKTVANLLIAGFTGQIKGLKTHSRMRNQQFKLINKHGVNELKEPILDNNNNNNNETIEDAMSTLIYNITKYFIGDPTYLKDRTVDQLSNLRCRKLQDFRCRKT